MIGVGVCDDGVGDDGGACRCRGVGEGLCRVDGMVNGKLLFWLL